MITLKHEEIIIENESKTWLTRNILLLGLVSFFADLSGEMMTPVLPLFIIAVGGTEAAVGFIGGLGDAVANFMKVLSGYISDRIGRRRDLILVGYGIPFFAKLGIGLSNTWEQVTVLKPTERLGKGIRGAPRDSLLDDSSPHELRGKVFGFHRTMDTAGAVLGSFGAILLVLLFFESELETLKLIIIIAAFISLLAVIPILLIQEPKQALIHERRKTSLMQNLKDLPPAYYRLLFTSTIFSLANFTILLFVLASKNVIPADESEQFKVIIPIAFFVLFSLVYTILSIPFGTWSDRVGRKLVYGIGMIIFILTCIGFIVADELWMLIVAFVLYGAFNAATDGIQKAYTVDVVPPELKGTGLGLLQTVTGFAGIIAGIIAGFLMAENMDLPFIYGGIMAAIALVILLALRINLWEEQSSLAHN
ncbi:MAG: MFS transporter [Candidatus Hodarchaeota archaeon]